MSEHTPGPWWYLKGSSETGIDGMLYTVGDPYGHGPMHVADVMMRGWGHMTGRGGGLAWEPERAAAVQSANASLISTAPDLLAVAKRLRDNFNRLSTRDLDGALRAIAKAEGR